MDKSDFENFNIEDAIKEETFLVKNINDANSSIISFYDNNKNRDLSLADKKHSQEISEYEKKYKRVALTWDKKREPKDIFKNFKFHKKKSNMLTFVNPKYKPIQKLAKINTADNGCKVHFVDCGQGDSIICENNGKIVVIDFGDDSTATKNKLDEIIKNNNISHNKKKIDWAICSHFDSDHIKGFPKVINDYYIENILMTNASTNFSKAVEYWECIQDSKNYHKAKLMELKNEINYNVHNFKVGDMYFTILGPNKKYDNNNDNSIVVKLNYKGKTFLFTGDAGIKAENDLIECCKFNKISLESTVFKAAHHGARKANSFKLLKEVKPKASVISCGKTNAFGHPHREALDNFKKINCPVFQTNDKGEITFNISADGEKITILADNQKYDTSCNIIESKKEKYKAKAWINVKVVIERKLELKPINLGERRVFSAKPNKQNTQEQKPWKDVDVGMIASNGNWGNMNTFA